jgi:purine-binding chemotaxis protein CheW
MEGVLMSADANAKRDEFLSFRLGAEEYAIDILQVREIRACEAVTRIANAPAHFKGVINLRGAIVPIVDLRLKLGHAAGFDATTVTIILHIAERLMGIVVDAVSDVVALLPGQVRPAPELSAGIDASFIRGLAPLEGRMLIVVDIARLMTTGELAIVEREAA